VRSAGTAADRRLVFRELGLALGLAATERMHETEPARTDASATGR